MPIQDSVAAQIGQSVSYRTANDVAFWERNHEQRLVEEWGNQTTVYECQEADPIRVYKAVGVLNNGHRVPVLFCQLKSDSPKKPDKWPGSEPLALLLAENQVVISGDLEKLSFPAAAPLALLRGEKLGEENANHLYVACENNLILPDQVQKSLRDKFLLETLHDDYRCWVLQIRNWMNDDSKLAGRHLYTLASNLHHETRTRFRWLMLYSLDPLSLSKDKSDPGNLRLLYGLARKGWFHWKRKFSNKLRST